MSDMEEPPLKVTKVEIKNEFEQGAEEMEEGQEEWLSEEILTDEEYQPVAEEQSDPNVTNISQEMTTSKVNDDFIDGDSQETIKMANIEKTLNSLENESKELNAAELQEFLIRKPDLKPFKLEKSEDGNDTDDLLRLLGEDDSKTKKKVLVKTKEKIKVHDQGSSDDDDDDEYIFEGATVTKLKVAKKALIKKYPATKALPEEMSDEEMNMSSDEAEDLKNIFLTQKTDVLRRPESLKYTKSKLAKNSEPHKYPSKNKMKLPTKPLKMIENPEKQLERERQQMKPSSEHDEIINEEEFLEEDGFDLDENFAESEDEEFETSRDKQLLMRPEQMDEEIPSDAESQSDEASIYDELPSSDSEELDDWFTLDIRTERAGDYIPLLGARAFELLTEEKKRVTERLVNLKKSLSSISESGRHQVEQLRKATLTLAELDDMMKAS